MMQTSQLKHNNQNSLEFFGILRIVTIRID